MNVYDFDDTIYAGESVFDFYLFCVKKKPKLIKHIPSAVSALVRYKLCRITKEELLLCAGKYIKLFFENFPDSDALICEFWDKNIKKIKGMYLKMQREDDVVISASWDRLVSEGCRRIGIKNVIASRVDCEKILTEFLCYGENKVEIFKKMYGDAKIENFYTDSKNDIPMIDISENAYLVRGERIKQIKYANRTKM